MTRAIELPESCSFSDYFKLSAYPDEILSYFGYGFSIEELELPTVEHLPIDIAPLQTHLRQALSLITLDNETARREFLIAPVLMELAIATQTKLRVSYPVEVSPQLRGSIDYFLQSQDRLLVIEAKDENLERGFKQLAVELIAIAQENQDSLKPDDRLWGAVSIGKVWQFSRLDLATQTIAQDINLYVVLDDLDRLLRGLIGILNGRSNGRSITA